MAILYKLFQKIYDRTLNSLCEASTILTQKETKTSQENYRPVSLINVEKKIFNIIAK